jgi:hypothetical protein
MKQAEASYARAHGKSVCGPTHIGAWGSCWKPPLLKFKEPSDA